MNPTLTHFQAHPDLGYLVITGKHCDPNNSSVVIRIPDFGGILVAFAILKNTYRHSLDDLMALKGSNGVIIYLAERKGPAGVVNRNDFMSCL